MTSCCRQLWLILETLFSHSSRFEVSKSIAQADLLIMRSLLWVLKQQAAHCMLTCTVCVLGELGTGGCSHSSCQHTSPEETLACFTTCYLFSYLTRHWKLSILNIRIYLYTYVYEYSRVPKAPEATKMKIGLRRSFNSILTTPFLRAKNVLTCQTWQRLDIPAGLWLSKVRLLST